MKISILGPCELRGPHGSVRLKARRQQIVLATLLWHANRVVPVPALIDAVWGSAPPASARTQIHICVSEIRRRLAPAGLPGLLETIPPGYCIRIGADELDLHVFDRWAAQGRAMRARGHLDEASGCFAEALRLWRGAPFAGLSGERITWMAERLAVRRLDVTEEYFDIRIRLGRGAEILTALTAMAEQYPSRERLRSQLRTVSQQARRYQALPRTG
ncbi:DNA-binding SARP family transcriptional activator [Kibdelosporangium banguiense]|uniref:DNA-binding SARP family transcriptional activator n=1 Tax=Kibdelosporangium banguiense TaxID=1365924 RepID=A0ABS4TSJ5_9PSEU|nr:BTAD domain-containing putative transcriptional regulator [Kibdelosporangium banguiense]MBP2327389.1 DNA-binding SARP family transcriptional activator [Kibdelosporangium banguiense]